MTRSYAAPLYSTPIHHHGHPENYGSPVRGPVVVRILLFWVYTKSWGLSSAYGFCGSEGLKLLQFLEVVVLMKGTG